MRNHQEFADLRCYADTVSCELEVITGVEADPASGDQLVLSLGKGTASEGALYAHLTGRRHRHTNSVEEVADCAPPILVTSSKNLTATLLDSLYNNPTIRSAPGIIAADDPNQLHSQVLLRAAAARLGGLARAPFSELYPILPFSFYESGVGSILGGAAKPEEVTKVLGLGHEVLSVLTHSDGIDAFLTKELSICPIGTVTFAGGTGTPYCKLTGECFRHNMSVEAALELGHILSPSAVTSRILLWAVCYGVLFPNSSLHPKWSLIRALLANPSVGAILTSWGVSVVSPYVLQPFMKAVYGGEKVGVALAKLNRSSRASEAGFRMCLFGDPDIRVGSRIDTAGRRLFMSESRRRGRTQGDVKGASFLSAYLRNAVVNCPPDVVEIGDQALRAVQFYEHMSANGREVEGAGDAAGPSMRSKVLDFLYKRGAVISIDWMSLVKKQITGVRKPCSTCGEWARESFFTFQQSWIPKRRILNCPICGIVEDATITNQMSISFARRKIQLEGVVPNWAWDAGVRLGCQNDRESVGIPWPKQGDGAPAREYIVSKTVPVGPLKIAVMMIEQATLTVLSRQTPPLV